MLSNIPMHRRFPVMDSNEDFYTTIYRHDTRGYFLLSKQHKVITDIDKLCFIGFTIMFPFIRFLTPTTNNNIVAIYCLLLGIFFGRSSNIMIFTILSGYRIMCLTICSIILILFLFI
jgi:hypothetical protein